MNKRIYHKPCVFVSQIETCNMLALSVEVKVGDEENTINTSGEAWSQERKGPWGGNPWGE